MQTADYFSFHIGYLPSVHSWRLSLRVAWTSVRIFSMSLKAKTSSLVSCSSRFASKLCLRETSCWSSAGWDCRRPVSSSHHSSFCWILWMKGWTVKRDLLWVAAGNSAKLKTEVISPYLELSFLRVLQVVLYWDQSLNERPDQILTLILRENAGFLQHVLAEILNLLAETSGLWGDIRTVDVRDERLTTSSPLI